MKTWRKYTVCILVILLTAIYFGNCWGRTGRSGEPEIVLAAARDLAPGNKDPYFSSIILKTWEPLIGISDAGEVQPKLAVSWQTDATCREWTFDLRKGVIFQDGTPFDADAVLANFIRYKNMGYRPSTFYGFMIERIYPHLQRVEKLDAYTVKLYFAKSVPMLIYRMAGWGSAMYSPHCFNEATGEWTGTAIGTGQFKIVERKINEYVILERFADYYGSKSKAQRIKIKVIPAPETRYSALKSGEIQGVIDLGGLPPILAEELLKDEKFAADSAKSTISHYLTLNGGRYPFSREEMRLALNLLVDREKIVQHYFRNIGTPTMSFLNSTNPFAEIVPAYTDRKKAVALAKNVLHGKRAKIKFIIHQYGVARYPYKVIAEYLQSEMRVLGLDAEIVIVDGMSQKKVLAEGDFDISIGTRGLGNLDPTSLLYDFFASGGSVNNMNGIKYCNPVVDECFKKLAHENLIDERAKLYRRINNELIEHPALVPLMEDRNLAVYSKRLTGYKACVYGITLDEVCWSKQEVNS